MNVIESGLDANQLLLTHPICIPWSFVRVVYSIFPVTVGIYTFLVFGVEGT